MVKKLIKNFQAHDKAGHTSSRYGDNDSFAVIACGMWWRQPGRRHVDSADESYFPSRFVLSDVGTYAPIADVVGGGRFTTNPGQVRSHDLAQYFGSALSAAFTIGLGQ
jgi:hypothetical protein